MSEMYCRMSHDERGKSKLMIRLQNIGSYTVRRIESLGEGWPYGQILRQLSSRVLSNATSDECLRIGDGEVVRY